MSKTKVVEKTDTVTVQHPDGSSETTTKTSTSKVAKLDEPDYIKIYTQMWSTFTGIPESYRELFMQLAVRMSYADALHPNSSQTVYTGTGIREQVMKMCGWTSVSMYQKGLKALVKCGALKRISRGVYQINPSYAGRGTWKYNPRLSQGGVKDIKATFDFANHDVSTEITWADDGEDTPFNESMREGLGVKASDSTELTYTTMKPKEVSE